VAKIKALRITSGMTEVLDMLRDVSS